VSAEISNWASVGCIAIPLIDHVLRAGREGNDAIHFGAQRDDAARRADRRTNSIASPSMTGML
jgi:hypothetical protein